MSAASHLALGIMRAPAGVPAGVRTVAAGRFAIGRGADNDWTLPDPDRSLSKRHCSFELREQAWFVVDTSSNGTWLNGRLLEANTPQMLRDGDQLAFGLYEIEAHFHAPPDWTVTAGPGLDDPSQDFTDDRLTGDPFPPGEGDAVEVAHPAVGLPGDFEPLVSGAMAGCAYVESDHVPDLHQNFRPPRPSFEVLPEDWDVSAAPPPGPPPQPPAMPVEQAAAPGLLPNATSQADAGTASAGFAAFAAGAGLPDAAVDDPDAALRALGAAFRAMVTGLRQTLMARATVKGEFRIEQTMLRARGNNPLKFSADDDDALLALLGSGRRTGMEPRQAVAEALHGMRLHELAVASAMQRATRDLLRELDPASALERAGSGLLGLPGARKRRAWNDHCQRYARLAGALSDEFDSVFGRSFARAYEASLAEVATQERRDTP